MEFNCENITLTDLDGKKHLPYTVAISYRNLTFYCKDACLTYDINGNGLDNWIELIDIEN